MKKIYDYQVNDQMDLFVLLKSADQKVARNGKAFLAITFQDRSGTINGMYWDASEEDVETYQAGRVVHLIGRRELYNDQPQVRISSLRLATEGEPNNPVTYLESTGFSPESIDEEIKEYLFKITNPNIARITRYLYQKYQRDFLSYPAAKRHHHAVSGGLSFHTLSILRLARQVVQQYEDIDLDLLYAGAILHDLGKTIELSGPISTDYTLIGNMIGHIVLIEEEICQACVELDIDQSQEDVILLKHMVLSHHGKQEYGSPVTPRIIEAEVLYNLDNLDASINMLQGALDKTEPGTYTEKIFGLDQRQFYRPTKNQ